MTEPRPRDRAGTERGLIQTARDLLRDTPYDAIRVRDIAAAAGCNHGLITQYFGSKLGLYTAVLHKLADDIDESIRGGALAADVLNQPATVDYWRLLASLLAAGLSPENVTRSGSSVVDLIQERASSLAGRDLSHHRDLFVATVCLIGGIQIFGPAFQRVTSEPSRGDNLDRTVAQAINIVLGVISQDDEQRKP